MSDLVEDFKATIEEHRALIEKLRNPDDPADIIDTTRLHAAAAIENMLDVVERAHAVLMDKVSETKLVKFGPGTAGWEMELKEGFIPHVAQYFIEVMGMDTDKPLNYVAIDINHHKFGALELSMQRKNGKTPSNLFHEEQNKTRWYEWWLNASDTMSSFQDAFSHYGGDFSVDPPSDDT